MWRQALLLAAAWAVLEVRVDAAAGLDLPDYSENGRLSFVPGSRMRVRRYLEEELDEDREPREEEDLSRKAPAAVTAVVKPTTRATLAPKVDGKVVPTKKKDVTRGPIIEPDKNPRQMGALGNATQFPNDVKSMEHVESSSISIHMFNLADPFNTLSTRLMFQDPRYLIAKNLFSDELREMSVSKTIAQIATLFPSGKSRKEIRIASDFKDDCVRVVSNLLAFSDSKKYNLDWIFYVSGQFNTPWYGPKYLVTETLMNLQLPYVPAEDSTLRDAAISDACSAAARVQTTPLPSRYLEEDTGPYSVAGLFYMSNLNSAVRALDRVPGDLAHVVDMCATVLGEAVEYFQEREVPLENLIRRVFGFNPLFGRAKWCTLGLSLVAKMAAEARMRFQNTGMDGLPQLNPYLKVPRIRDVFKNARVKTLVQLYNEYTEQTSDT